MRKAKACENFTLGDFTVRLSQSGHSTTTLLTPEPLGYCGFLDSHLLTGGACNHTFASEWRPMDVILSDTPELYNIQTRTLVPNGTAFKNSGYLAGLTRPAFWLLFIGTLCAGVALITYEALSG